MKGTITIVGNDLKLTLAPESDIERLVFKELGDEMSISRCHHDIVLRRRGPFVHSLANLDDPIDVFDEDLEEVEETSSVG